MSEKRTIYNIATIAAFVVFVVFVIVGFGLPSYAIPVQGIEPTGVGSVGPENRSGSRPVMNDSMNATGIRLSLKRLEKNFKRFTVKERERLEAAYQNLSNNEQNIINNMSATVQRRYLEMSQNKLRQRLKKLRVIGTLELNQIRKTIRTEIEIRNTHQQINKFESNISKSERKLSQQRQNLQQALNGKNLSDQITAVKKYLNTTVSLLQNWIKSKQASINSLETVNQQFINQSQQMLSKQLLELKNISLQTNNATTKDQLKSINQKLMHIWNNHYKMNEMLSITVNARSTGEYILRADMMKTKLENALSAAEEKGENISIVNGTISQFDNAINLSENYYLQAKQALNTTSSMNVTEKIATYKNVRELLQKSRSSIADANKYLVKIIRTLNHKRVFLHFKNSGGYVINRNIVSELNKSPEFKSLSLKK